MIRYLLPALFVALFADAPASGQIVGKYANTRDCAGGRASVRFPDDIVTLDSNELFFFEYPCRIRRVKTSGGRPVELETQCFGLGDDVGERATFQIRKVQGGYIVKTADGNTTFLGRCR